MAVAMTDAFIEAERAGATAWKARTPTLPDEARAPTPYIRDGKPTGRYPCVQSSNSLVARRVRQVIP